MYVSCHYHLLAWVLSSILLNISLSSARMWPACTRWSRLGNLLRSRQLTVLTRVCYFALRPSQ